MKIAVGSDHRGIDQRKTIAAAVESLWMNVVDCGTNSTESADYPDQAKIVAQQVANRESDKGILVCGTGIGMSMAANKVRGIRAAVCHDPSTAELSRQHNDANVLCIPGSLNDETITEMVKIWLTTDFEGGRHQRRVDKVMQIENCGQEKIADGTGE